ncbi:aldehyde dehydrogenase family protein [Fictibacillus enclensis]|uniref:aldehyde dehydrogenase family protein n=1 Tax=Fictibacillus enclensis TaxID=1017270 RepID=UPI0024BF64A9|nr:aldehyde dehydrogenase family protein [Fictibacillus enclensis]WHY70958.1 aldehyde dehydrogenase family protein [Fictibacillus enclensis]
MATTNVLLNEQKENFQYGSTFKNYINGEWVPSISGEISPSINPGNIQEVLGYFQKSNVEDVQAAIKSAKDSFLAWSKTSVIKRGDVLFNLIYLLEQEKEELATLITKEVGKTIKAARLEVEASIQALKHFSGEANRLAGETVPANDPNTFTCTIKEPLGVVAVVTPFNFPLGIGIYKIAPAILAGNTVIFKPASDTSLIGVKTVELFVKAGIPKGVLNLITGPGSVIGQEFSDNKEIKAVSFTGSSEIGIALGRAVTSRGAKMQAEMGGKNATIILEDADIEQALKGVVTSGFINNGQSCTGTSRLIVPRSIAKKVTELLVKEASAINVGDGFAEEVHNGAVANEQQLKTYLHYVKTAIDEGATLEYGGEKLTDLNREKGYFVSPTVFSGVNKNMTIAKEEIFGPVVAVMEVENYNEAIDLANDIEFGLSSAIYTNDLEKAFYFIRHIDTGVTHVNIPSNHYENQLPFGGKKDSSIGPREQGSSALDFWVETKAVYIKPY